MYESPRTNTDSEERQKKDPRFLSWSDLHLDYTCAAIWLTRELMRTDGEIIEYRSQFPNVPDSSKPQTTRSPHTNHLMHSSSGNQNRQVLAENHKLKSDWLVSHNFRDAKISCKVGSSLKQIRWNKSMCMFLPQAAPSALWCGRSPARAPPSGRRQITRWL